MLTTIKYFGVRSMDMNNLDATEYGYGTMKIIATMNQNSTTFSLQSMPSTIKYDSVRIVDMNNVDATEYGCGTKMIIATTNQTRQLSLSRVCPAQ